MGGGGSVGCLGYGVVVGCLRRFERRGGVESGWLGLLGGTEKTEGGGGEETARRR